MIKRFNIQSTSEKINDLVNFLQSIKSREQVSNVTFTIRYLQELEKQDRLWINIGTQSSIILIADNDDILRLYFYASKKECLKEVISLIPGHNGSIICDVIGRDEKIGELVKALGNTGFEIYAKFQRMLCNDINVVDNIEETGVEFARPKDVDEILDITYSEFDPLTARIPSRGDLLNKINNKEVFIVRKDDRIAGFTSFDSNNKKVALLDHVIVRPEYRNQNIARRILYYKWTKYNQSKFYILWINELCKGPIKYHECNGFTKDGIYDYVLTLRKEVN